MQELLYTSVPRGLKPGSRGFCTVLSTQGMVAPLAAALEGLSGYRPVFPLGHERVAENPVVYSHLKLQVAGKSWSVLSRIADYGLDYSQRTNKLAHHLVLDKSELPTAGPASLLRAAGIMRESWEGDPKIVPPKPISRLPSAPSGMCQAWKEMTGDAGWAGVLAESFLKDPNRPVIMLFEPGQDLRPLIDESLSLLPAERRWDVTFNTYFTGSSQGITCLWRGIVLGSKEATESLRFVNALRIDLTSTDSGRAEGGELVEAARKGVRPSTRPAMPPKQAAPRERPETRVVLMDDADERATPRTAHAPAEAPMQPVMTGGHDHTQEPPVLTRSAFKFANASRQINEDDSRAPTSQIRRFIIPLVTVLVVGCLLVFLVPVVNEALRNRKPSNSQSLASQNSADGPSARPQPTTPQPTFLDKSIRVASKVGEDPIQLKQGVVAASLANQTVTLRLVPPRNDFPIRGGEADANKLPILCTAKVAGSNETKQFAELKLTASSDLVFKRTDNHGNEKAAANLSLCLIELSVPGGALQLIALNSNEIANLSEKDGILTVNSDRLKYANDANLALSLHDLVIKYHHNKKEQTVPDQTMPFNKSPHNEGRLIIPTSEGEKKIAVVVRLGKPGSQTGQVSLDLVTEPTQADADKELTDKVDELKEQLDDLIKKLKEKQKDEEKAKEEKKQTKFNAAASALEKVVMNLKGHRKVSNETIEMAVGKPFVPDTPDVRDEVRKEYDKSEVPKTIKDCESLLATKELVDSLAKAKVVRATVRYQVEFADSDKPIVVDLLKLGSN